MRALNDTNPLFSAEDTRHCREIRRRQIFLRKYPFERNLRFACHLLARRILPKISTGSREVWISKIV